MAGFKSLDRGFNVDIHISINERSRDRIDALCKKYNAARGVVIDALLDEHEKAPLQKYLSKHTDGRKRSKTGG